MAKLLALIRRELAATVWLVLIVVVVGTGLVIARLYRGLVAVFCMGCLGGGLVIGLAMLALACTGYGLYSLGYWVRGALVALDD